MQNRIKKKTPSESKFRGITERNHMVFSLFMGGGGEELF